MRVLILVGWNVLFLDVDDPAVRKANKSVVGEKYWFFNYMPDPLTIDVAGIPKRLEHTWVNKLGLHNLPQACEVFSRLDSYDAVVSHHSGSALFLALMRRIFKKTVPPHVLIDVGLPYYVADFKGIRRKIIRCIFSSVDVIIYHSSIQRDFYRNFLGFKEENIFFIPFGIDPTDFFPIETSIGNYVISVGDGARDYTTLLQASRDIKSCVKIVSQRYRINSEDLPSNVQYSGYLPISVVKTLIAASKLVILPLENVPSSCGHSVLLQSMAMEKAVVVSDVPGVTDYVIDGETALLCEPDNPKDLALKVNFLLSNPDKAAEIGKKARKAVLDEFTEERMALKIYDVLSKV
jgi:glycosyltransferase involved in cell wall biosynthesis